MSVTNAISGIILVGALLQIGHGSRRHGAGVRGDPGGQHQHLRWLRRHPPHARRCSPTSERRARHGLARRRLHRRRLLFILSLAGLSRHETAKNGNVFGIAGMAIALAATIGLATRSITAIGITLLVAAMVVGARSASGGPAGSR